MLQFTNAFYWLLSDVHSLGVKPDIARGLKLNIASCGKKCWTAGKKSFKRKKVAKIKRKKKDYIFLKTDKGIIICCFFIALSLL